MADIDFSPKQREVIDTRDKNILVSAAAGSGKTAVLVQRIIERVLGKEQQEVDERDLIDIDKILVLTYTEAAAGEMRARIEDAINKRAQKYPENKRIAKQAVLVHNAQISTIHGFCLSLIRNNFTEINIDPSFRVAESGEIKMVEDEIAQNLIDEMFDGEMSEDFRALADRFARKNSLSRLKETILETYSVARNNPFVEDYLRELKDNYVCDEDEDILDTEWGNQLREYTREQIRQAKELTVYNIEYSENGPYMYTPALESDLELIERLLECETYEEYYQCLNNLSFERLSTKKDESISDESKKYSQEIRKEVKSILGKLSDDFYCSTQDKVRLALGENEKIVRTLSEVLLRFGIQLETEKKKRKIIDFSDMEHYALRILLKKENGMYVATQVAKDYRTFFKEIMVDEYQDSNHVQEYILKAISGEDDGVYNRFMVGDVKQSIYSFRNACPELFMEKYEEYAGESLGNVRIDLSTNYRSRNEVLESVNYIFEKIMAADLGGVDYDEDAKLNLGAKYVTEGNDYNTELLLLDYDAEAEVKKQEQEARMVALKINELVNGDKAYILEGNRPCEYKDIVILLRSNKGWDDVFKDVLEQYGIPAYVASKTGYFSATEIKRILNLLQVLDNPRDEVALYGALRAFGHITEDDIAIIRAYSKDELYESIKAITEGTFENNKDISSDLLSKCQHFYTFISKYRGKTVYTPINELLEEIIEETGYINEISSMPLGEQRVANVFMLIEKAKQYESASFKGLYHFIRYINEIQSFEIDYGEASVLDEQSNVVRIMSIHKSKGLEFPVCFVCGTGKNFNMMDSKSEVIYDRKLGIALDYVDIAINIKYSDLRHKFISHKLREDNVAEEIRVLYVALTRAKEKLYITGCQSKIDTFIEKCRRNRQISGDEKTLSRYVRSKATSFLELILDSIDIECSESVKTSIMRSEDLECVEITTNVSKEQRKRVLQNDIIELKEESDTSRIENAKNKITFKYMHENLEHVYTKTSVSELKMAEIEKAYINHELEDIADNFFEVHETVRYVPKFVTQDEKVSGTTRGTAYHRVMELIFLENTHSLIGIDSVSQDKVRLIVKDEITQLVSKGRIDATDAELVDVDKVARFLESELGRRMILANERKQLFVEEPFVLGIGADRLNNTYPSNEMVLIQGIIDAFFIEDGKVFLVDYKTDKVAYGKELVKKYQLQLEYYKEAIERITDMVVSKKLIYSFALGEVIEC